jgi:GLPGLI family protein
MSSCIIGFSQQQGEISYTTKVNLHANLPDDENGRMIREMTPEFQEMHHTLLFTKDESLYQSKKETEETNTFEQEEGDVQIQIEMAVPDEKIYTDIKNGLIVEQRDLMGKRFLIKDSIRQNDWHILEESKIVMGINCQKAALYQETDTIEVWYTTEIPISTGPAGFGGLPGLIVQVSMDQGLMEITATKYIKRTIEKKEIKAPTKGKVVTDKQFRELEEKKMKELQEQYGGNGGQIIMITE